MEDMKALLTKAKESLDALIGKEIDLADVPDDLITALSWCHEELAEHLK